MYAYLLYVHIRIQLIVNRSLAQRERESSHICFALLSYQGLSMGVAVCVSVVIALVFGFGFVTLAKLCKCRTQIYCKLIWMALELGLI